MKQIWAHTLVRNEEKWLWFSVGSVINCVDRVLLWDMESEDKTPFIIKELKKRYPKKISVAKVPKVTPEGFSKIRQEMLDETEADWFIVVDGDEIWWDDSIRKVTDKIKAEGRKYETVVVPVKNMVGDIFHFQEDSAGRYRLAGRKGHLALRGVNRKIPGLSSRNPHGTWGWTDASGKMIQDRDSNLTAYIDAPYIHTTHLPRAGKLNLDRNVIKRSQKLKYEVGIKTPADFFYPEIFFREKPEFIPSPWFGMDKDFYFKALLETPFRKLKRRLYKGKAGY